MKRSVFKKPFIFFLGIAVIFILFKSSFASTRGFLWFLWEPIAHQVREISNATSSFFSAFGSIHSLKEDNDRLYHENIQLQSQRAQCQDIEHENNVLREAIDMAPRHTFEVENAFVIGMDATGVYEWVMVDKGSKDGIERGMPVVVQESILVGRVDEVFYSSSRIQLLTSERSVVSVQTTQTQTKGVVRGQYGINLLLDMVLHDTPLSHGDLLVTSRESLDYPEGLFVGEVRSPQKTELFQKAVVMQPIVPRDIQVVSILKRKN